jgi:hypothetical protein
MEGKKSEWQVPELIVLVRSRPEEQVLAACKTPGIRGLGASNAACKITGTPCNVNAPS